jgi:cytochrome oxidase assembly protein ShyY1
VLRIITSPRMIALHVLTIALVAIMLSFANWQWTRHNDRQDFNDQVRARATQTVQPLENVLSSHTEPDDAQWFTASVTGTYGEPTFQLVNVSQNGAAGYDVVTPLTLQDGRVVVVNRGFLPLAEPMPTDVAGRQVTVIGRVRVSDTKQFGEIDNSAQSDLIEIQRIDLQILDDVIDGDVLDVSIDALESTPSDDPRLAPVAEPTLSSGPHLSYTVQWILFSVCAIAAWALLVRRALRQGNVSAQPE